MDLSLRSATGRRKRGRRAVHVPLGSRACSQQGAALQFRHVESLAPVTTLTLLAALLLLVVNLNLYVSFGNRFLLLWALAWGFYSARFVFDLMRFLIDWDYWFVPVQMLTVASGVMLMTGGFQFLPAARNRSRVWISAAVLAGVWPIVAALAELGLSVAATPPFVFVGIVNLFIAWQFYLSKGLDSGGRWIVVVSFALWGLHKFDYPILRPIPGVAPWGYAAGSFFAVSAGIGLLIIYLAAERQRAQASESRFRGLVGSLDDIVFTLDPEGRPTGVFGVSNGRAQAISGSAEHRAPAMAVYRRNASVTYELELSEAGGSRFFQTTLSPIRRPSGACTEVVGVARDITSLKNTVTEKEALLREVHHRVKNNLQIVGSLLSLQMQDIASGEAKAAFSASIGRIYALGDVHDILYSAPNVSRIAAQKLCSTIVNRIFNSHPSARRPRTRIAVDGLAATLDTAVPLSLVITEVVAAAAEESAKDASLPQYVIRAARLDTTLRFELARATGRRIGESAPPMSALRMKLVDALLAQLGATMDRTATSTTIVVPDLEAR